MTSHINGRNTIAIL